MAEEALATARRLPEDRPSRVEIENAGANLVTFLIFKEAAKARDTAAEMQALRGRRRTEGGPDG